MKDGLYTIGEFASLLGVSKAVIYNWEKEGKINRAQRIRRGKTMYRFYTTDDIRDARMKMSLQSPSAIKRKQLFLNFKGGTGKSVISANYGYRLAQHGYKILMVDLDPQGHLTKCLGCNPESFSKTLFDVIINKVPIQSAIVSTSMSTMDIIKHYGGNPANFLDVGGGATEEQVTEAFKILSADTKVKAILVNIFGGNMRCDIIAQGIINAVKATNLPVPLIVRLEGTNVAEGKKLLEESQLPLHAASDLADAAQKAVAAAHITT